MSAERLRAMVGWTVEDPPATHRAGRVLGGLLHALSTVVTLGADASMGAPRPTWDVPADPDDYLDLGPVELRWPSSARAERVQATQRDVWTTPPGRPASRVPLAACRIVEAVPQDGAAGHGEARHPEAPWTLTLTDGRQTGTLTGAWLALAWVGSLAGWPEPARGEPARGA